jgi:hypothetical protein
MTSDVKPLFMLNSKNGRSEYINLFARVILERHLYLVQFASQVEYFVFLDKSKLLIDSYMRNILSSSISEGEMPEASIGS